MFIAVSMKQKNNVEAIYKKNNLDASEKFLLLRLNPYFGKNRILAMVLKAKPGDNNKATPTDRGGFEFRISFFKQSIV